MTDENTFSVLEWTITNISFRKRETLYQDSGEEEGFFKENKLWLFLHSRMRSGHIVVRVLISGEKSSDISGDISFLCPDGSLIGPPREFHRRELPRDKYFDVFGPSFEWVVERLRSFPEERLTVRMRIRSKLGSVHVYRSVLDVHRSSLKVSLSSAGTYEGAHRMDFFLDGREVKAKMTIKAVDGNFELALHRPKCDRIEVHTHMSVLAADGSVTRTELNEHTFIDPDDEIWVFSKLLATASSETTDLLMDFAFSLGFVRTYASHSLIRKGELSITPASFAPSSEDTPVQVLASDLGNLFQDGDLADFEIGCEDVTFAVHRSVLSARSPVLKAMLAGDFREPKSGRLDVPDLDAQTISRFLSFLYTGAVKEEVDCDAAVQLHIAADKYQVPSLKKQCAILLGANVCASNVCQILCLAERHRDEELFAHACKFLSKNFVEVERTEEWKILLERDPSLVCRALSSI